jgi:hypothetical protein
MLDYINDGEPMETPVGARAQGFLSTPPSEGEKFGAMLGETSPVGMLYRYEQRDIASQQAQSLNVKEPLLSAEDVNKQYAPIGPDGKQVPITTEPMYGRVAKLVGQAKANELDREGVLSRAAANDGTLHTFGLGLAAFVADPLNVATMFIPGVGEERTLAALGQAGIEGGVARAGARVVAGATGGAMAQAPLSALKYGLGTQEASDYDLRSAFKDMAYAAAGGAILHAGLGAVGDAWKAKGTVMPTQQEIPPIEESPTTAPVEAKEVLVPQNLSPLEKVKFTDRYLEKQSNIVYAGEDLESYREKNAAIIGQEELYEPWKGMVDKNVVNSLESIPKRIDDINTRLKDTNLPPDWREVLETYRQKLATVAEKYSEFKDLHTNEIALSQWRGEISGDEAKTILGADANTKDAAMRSAVSQMVDGREISVAPLFAKDTPLDLQGMAENQRQIYREGTQPGMTSGELEAATKEIFEKEKAVQEKNDVFTEKPTKAAEVPKSLLTRLAESVGLKKPVESVEPEMIKTGIASVDARQPEIDALEENLDRAGMTSEELGEVADSSNAYNDALTNLAQKMDALKECLARTGG